MGGNRARQALHSANFSMRQASFATCLAIIACWMAWPIPLGAAEAQDACKLLDGKLGAIGTDAPDPLVLKQLADAPSAFHAELSNRWLSGRAVASVTFEGKRIAAIADADSGKICVKAYTEPRNEYLRVVPIQQAFLEKEKDGQSKHLKVIFYVDPPSSDFYNKVEYLFVGMVADATPTFFSYSVKVPVINNRSTVIVSLLFVAIAYLVLAWATLPRKETQNTSQLGATDANQVDAKDPDETDAEDPGQVQELAYVLSPIRITAGWFGDASMSQVQLVLFTFIVAGLLFHVWLTTGLLSDISKELLILLGISAVGAGGARFAQTLKVDLKPELARFLIGKGWYRWKLLPLQTQATFRNLVLTDGRLDVYKFQMAIFTVVVACYVISAGQTDLGEIKISETMLYLIGISQGVYVGGKAVTDRTTDLGNAVAKMMDLETKILAEPDPKKREPLVAEYEKAARFAVEEFAPLYNRKVPTKPKSEEIRPDVLEPRLA
jgi:Ca2+/Na+ antiporter